MTSPALSPNPAAISTPAARAAIAGSGIVLLALAALHLVSPEFDPSLRMVSEYANGHYPWLLSIMFLAWGASTWALAVAIRSQLNTRLGLAGLLFLILAGVGESMAAAFDVNHPLHGLAAAIGIPGLAIAAMLTSLALVRSAPWATAKKPLLWTANATWASIVLMAIAMMVMMRGYAAAGNKIAPDAVVVAGYANRLLIVMYCVWVSTVAWYALRFARGLARSATQ